ncbi:MAG: aminoacyl-tRNA hydrolase [Candidatus Paceibacterota bacterium]|jgi:PTH1 family peptidyl-tRNA hydrolase
MKLIAGLGNYGPEYEKTRHNYGFMVIDEIQRKHNFPAFKLEKAHNALISKKGNVLLVKPQTYMNESGKAIKSIAAYYKVNIKDIIIIHDDAETNLGEIKEVEARSAAGHNGVRSIIDELKTNEFKRLKLGINSEDSSFKNKPLEDVVLKNFSKAEEIIALGVIEKAVEMIISKVVDLIV